MYTYCAFVGLDNKKKNNVANRYGLDGLKFESRQRQEILFSIKPSRRALGSTQPHFCYTMAFFHTVKRPRREVDHHLHIVQRLRMSGAILLLPLHVFMVRRGTIDFTFTVTPRLKLQGNGEIVDILRMTCRNMCSMNVELY